MRIVLDTNVLVSGLLKPYSVPAQVLRLVVSGDVRLCCDSRIIAEYEQVLRRPKFSFRESDVTDFIEYIRSNCAMVVPTTLIASLPDPDDEPFLEVALSGEAKCLVTGNIKHFVLPEGRVLKILTPQQFVEFYRQERVG